MKARHGRTALLIVNLLGAVAVLGSYAQGFLAHPGSATALWGNVPAILLPFYTASMLTAAVGYLLFTFFILFRLDPEGQNAGRASYGTYVGLYAAILVASALWMPLTFSELAAPSLALWVAIRIVLAIVGLAALAMLVSLLGTRPVSHRLSHGLAVAGAVFFLIQTGVLDAIVWPAYFPRGF